MIDNDYKDKYITLLEEQIQIQRRTIEILDEYKFNRGKKRPQVSSDEVETIQKLNHQGLSTYEIAKKINRSEPFVRKYLNLGGEK